MLTLVGNLACGLLIVDCFGLGSFFVLGGLGRFVVLFLVWAFLFALHLVNFLCLVVSEAICDWLFAATLVVSCGFVIWFGLMVSLLL